MTTRPPPYEWYNLWLDRLALIGTTVFDRRPLVLEATAVPTKPQYLPKSFFKCANPGIFFVYFCSVLIQIQMTNI